MTFKGLVGITPSGATTFISQLYTGNTFDREIVHGSDFLDLNFGDGDSVMADKGFTIDEAWLPETSDPDPPAKENETTRRSTRPRRSMGEFFRSKNPDYVLPEKIQ